MSAVANLVSRYRTVQVSTSSPGEILVMLYDGLLRFLGEARSSIEAGDRARAGEKVGRAHAILDELAATLDAKADPQLCERLLSLYLFSMRRVVDANVQQDPAGIDEVVRVLSPLADAWRSAVRGAPTAPLALAR